MALKPAHLSLVEASLPRLVFGNNYTSLMDPLEAVRAMKPLVDPLFDRQVDLAGAELDRVDLAYNHIVGQHVRTYIDQMFRLEYPARETKPFYPAYGVQYHCKNACLKFYDKEEECGIPAAYGILREEASYLDKRTVRRALGRPEAGAYITDFTPDVVERILRRENEKLGLNDTVLADSRAAIRCLIENCGIKRGMRLFAYMSALGVMADDDLKKLGVSAQTLWRNKKQIERAGLWRTLGTDQTLPALSVNLANNAE
jgi:hypothetical protein